MKLTKRLLNNLSYKTVTLLLALVCYLPNVSYAVEQQLDKETTLFNQTFSWQAMVGFSAYSTPNKLKGVEQEGLVDYLSLSLLIDLYYKGFFIQSNHRRSIGLTQGAELGYQLHIDDNWEIDILAKSYIAGYIPDDLIESKGEDIPSISGLKEREIGSAIALRYSYFNNDSILSVDVANFTHWSETNGWLIDLYYNDLFIYRNWDIYIGGGITYYSSQVTNYYYGIDTEEVTSAREYYKPSASFKGTFEIYAQYPISKKWSFNAGITQTYYSDVIERSPIIDKQHLTQFLLGVVYVF